MYKRHCDKYAVRFGFDYYYTSFKNQHSGDYYFYKNDGKSKIGELRLGYERKLTNTKLQPYIAADLALTYGQIKGIRGGTDDLTGDYTVNAYDIRIRIKGIGFAPAIGLKYRPIERLSITAETNVILAYYKQENIEDNRKNYYWQLFYNPLRLLSLNYHF